MKSAHFNDTDHEMYHENYYRNNKNYKSYTNYRKYRNYKNLQELQELRGLQLRIFHGG